MSEKPTLTIRQAQFPEDLEIVTSLFSAYVSSLGIDLSYQNYEQELSNLPGKYSPQYGGALLLASVLSTTQDSTSSSDSSADSISTSSVSPSPLQKENIIGCACLRAFEPPKQGEVKRFYINPESRRLGAGRKLLERIIAEAKKCGYQELYLDTLESMMAARKLYSSFGFEEVENYYGSPLAGTVFYWLRLE
jgi:ribosomal protein S18 acetylase RimI-like enzyme